MSYILHKRKWQQSKFQKSISQIIRIETKKIKTDLNRMNKHLLFINNRLTKGRKP